ncbi:MAG TPA: HlyD family efflux transporter periplasmic adaptor subunit [Bacteroidia bacterium]|nr:HlyD family efflux transporter periplasmic adaptor subunit [Bacteroidia bacterium]
MKKYFPPVLFFLAVIFFAAGCSAPAADEEEDSAANVVTPVNVTHVLSGPISSITELSAVTMFQKKISVRAPVSGYISEVDVNPGSTVREGQALFSVKTKEASALDRQHVHDSLLGFPGDISIAAQKAGTITSLSHQKGDFVQEGDELAVISDASSLVFLLQVPFEMRTFIKTGMDCSIVLPGGQELPGKITGSLPEVDAASQTQQFIVKANSTQPIPENLVARVRIVKSTKQNATIIPKTAVLTDETQSEFWVMKLISDSVAVKTIITKGIENRDTVEILSPAFTKDDLLVTEGNYGLPDTAKVSVRNR